MERDKEENLIETYQAFMNIGLGAGDPGQLPELVDERIFGIGTAVDEKIYGIPEVEKLIENQKKQSHGLDIRWRQAPTCRYITEDENTAVFADDIYLTIRAGEEIMDMYLRFSVVLNYVDDQWKVIHWHGSKPEHVESEKDTWGVDSWKQRAHELELLVEEKTADLVNKNRELEIVAALEKVRAAAMGMREPADMADVCRTISLSLDELGVTDIRNVQTAVFYPEKGIYLNYEYFKEENRSLITEVAYREQPDVQAFVNEMLAGPESVFMRTFEGDELRQWTAYQHKAGQYVPPRQESSPELHYLFHSIGSGALGLSAYRDLTDEQRSIMLRFRHVFAMAYRRYSDIEKAQAQAREAQVEAALENVRSRALAMQKSNELIDVVRVLYEKLGDLMIPVTAVGIGIYIEGSKDYQVYVCGQGEGRLAINTYRLPYFNHRIANDLLDAREKGLDFFTGHYPKEEKDSFYAYVFEHSVLKDELPDAFRQFIFQSPVYTISAFPTKHAVIHINDFEGKSLSAAEIDVLRRFAHVFEQAYTRFLDLQKAEAQAREAQIEAALERVRGRSMAMHNSEELSECAELLFRELSTLGGSLWSSGFAILDDHDEGEGEYRTTDQHGDRDEVTYIPHGWDPTMHQLYAGWKQGKAYMSLDLGGEDIKRHYANMLALPKSGQVFQAVVDAGFAFPEWQQMHAAYFKQGYLLVISLDHYHGSDLLVRFARVFEQTYTRFLDLKKAEAQAREAQVEAALERVRSRSLSMRRTDELQDVVNEVARQLLSMGIDIDGGIFVAVNAEVEKDFPIWASAGAADYVQKVTIPFLDSPIFTRLRNAVIHREPFLTEFYSKAEKDEFLRHMFRFHPWNQNSEERKAELLARTGGYARSVSVSSHTAIGMINHHGKIFPEADNAILRRFGAVLEQSYTRFLDLQKAEAQAREAQIEAALERVRARTMGMQRSEELKDVIQVVYEQFVHLGIPTEHAGFIMDYKATDDFNTWIADEFGSPSQVTIPYFDCIYYNRFKQAKEEGIDFFATTLSREEKDTFYETIFKCVPGIPEESKRIIFSHPGFTISTVLLEHVALYIENFTGIPFSDEADALLMRFGKVFQQTYSRFLDLQKAEALAREAEIELALERIRSQAMAMKESADLLDIVVTMRREFTRLGHEAQYFWHMMWLPDKYEKAMTSGDGTRIGMVMQLPRHIHGDIPLVANWEKGQEPTVVYAMDVDAAVAYVDKMIRLGDFKQVDPQAPTLDDIRHIGGLTFIMARTTHGEIGYSLPGVVEHPPAEDLMILERFAGAFDIAHRRFLDLQKSEAIARETLVSLSLERIRANAMAMKVSSDLFDIVVDMRNEFVSLGHQADYFWHMRWLPDAYEMAMTSDDGSRIGMMIRIPKFVHEGMPALSRWEKSSEPLFVLALDPDEAWAYVDSMNTYGQYELVDPNAPTREDIRHIGGLTFVMARTTHGEIGFGLPGMVPHPPEDALETLVRFAGVFDLAYKRFLDLQRAEAQARTAMIEAALERVRARALAMQEPEELREIAKVLRHEMGLLGVEELETSTVFIHDRGSEQAECWFAIRKGSDPEEGLVSDHISLDLPATWVGRQMDGFFNSEDVRSSILMQGPHRREWIEYCYGLSSTLDGFYGESIPDRTYHLYKFSNGAIGAAAPGDISTESWDLLQRTASVFSLAYARFRDLTQARVDLQRLKDEKLRAEQALTELRAAQAQLVQSEKMASLGELTAGIAHEIKNPLNFVNNFAEVSGELFDELKAATDPDERAELIDMLQNNLDKINEHGKRADAIVRSMLQHSRSESGKMEPTDLNALADEYLRLAYHGLRAKDKSFNATFAADLDPALPKVDIVPQDIGRVLLNLINNAFYAVSERQHQGERDYVPTVTVRTMRAGDSVEIHVTDNGAGIPKGIRDKIFQPFFTTKPTGQGTGLGLSLAYDIVTKGHRGDLRVETEEGAGTTFTIALPRES